MHMSWTAGSPAELSAELLRNPVSPGIYMWSFTYRKAFYIQKCVLLVYNLDSIKSLEVMQNWSVSYNVYGILTISGINCSATRN